MLVFNRFFIKYNFLQFNDFFPFHDAYNSCLKERYDDDHSTHPDMDSNLWLEVGSSGEPGIN